MARKSSSRNLAPRPAYRPAVTRSKRRRTLIDTFPEYQKIGKADNKNALGTLVSHTRDVVETRKAVRALPKPLERATCKQRPKNTKSKGGNSRRYVPYCTKKG